MPRRAITLHLTRRPDGHFVKKIDGRIRFFGNESEAVARARLIEFLRLRERGMLADDTDPRELGPAPPVPRATVESVADRFLDQCRGKVRGITFRGYEVALDDFGAAVGPGTLVDDLKPADFAAARACWAETLGPWALDRKVQAVRTAFNWALAHRLIDRTPFYAASFSKTTAGDKRRAAREREKDGGGPRIFKPKELAAILAEAKGPLRAMVLLALNGGMYAKDVAGLRRSDVRREGRVTLIDYVREKTDAVPWRFPLWPETAAALAPLLNRPPPRPGRIDRTARDPADADLVFVTRFGRAYVREHADGAGGGASVDTIAQEFDKLLARLNVKRAGLSFGAFRHTHTTATGDHPDRNAARRVRGHQVEGIESHYDKLTLARLKSVTDLARSRLLVAPAARASSAARSAGGSGRSQPRPRKPRRPAA